MGAFRARISLFSARVRETQPGVSYLDIRLLMLTKRIDAAEKEGKKMRLYSPKKWHLPLTLIVVLGIGLGTRPVWGQLVTRGEGNQSVMLQPLADNELAEIAGRNAWVPLPVLIRESLSESRNRTLQTLSNISKQASALRQQGRIILDSDLNEQALFKFVGKVSDTLGRVRVRFPNR